MEGGHDHPTARRIGDITSNVNDSRRRCRSKPRVKIVGRNRKVAIVHAQSLDKPSVAQRLDGVPSDGEPAFPHKSSLSDRLVARKSFSAR